MQSLLLPRGIRNNNPGNLRLGKIRWQGQRAVQTDTAFVEFTDPVMGLRALMRTLLTYYRKYGLDTVESIINRFAPPHENATDSYIHAVAKALGVGRRDTLAVNDLLIPLAAAITRHENGPPPAACPQRWYDDKTYAEAARLAQQPAS